MWMPSCQAKKIVNCVFDARYKYCGKIARTKFKIFICIRESDGTNRFRSVSFLFLSIFSVFAHILYSIIVNRWICNSHIVQHSRLKAKACNPSDIKLKKVNEYFWCTLYRQIMLHALLEMIMHILYTASRIPDRERERDANNFIYFAYYIRFELLIQ